MTSLPKIYFLTGFMGVGKTYWADRISARLNMQCFDTDREIEKKQETSISAIIERKGLREFRQTEKECLRELLTGIKTHAIVSLGGGTLLDPENLDLVKKKGTLIWLKGKGRPLSAADKKKRPLYDKEKRDKLYLERKESYLKADHIVDLDNFEENTEIEAALIQIIND